MVYSPELIETDLSFARRYMSLFINQTAFSLQRDDRENPTENRFYRPHLFYGSSEYKVLTLDTVRRHLRGEVTCMWYGADPKTQTSKWVALDADYAEAERDLLRIREELLARGVISRHEESRRGGHLWFFCAEPLPAADVRALVLDVLRCLGLPLASSDGKAPGIEVFPRQDKLEDDRIGNGIRGPLGVHRKDFKRYWFREAGYSFDSQLGMLEATPRLSAERLSQLLAGLKSESPAPSKPMRSRHLAIPNAFSIFTFYPSPGNSTADYKVVCPACREKRLVITARGPRRGFYHCFTGCATKDIRAALGQPLRIASRR